VAAEHNYCISMSDNFQEIDGVGPAREEHLEEAGYDSYAGLAGLKPNTLEEDIPRLSEDKALEIIVQSQNLADLKESEPESNSEVNENEESETMVKDNDSDSSETVSVRQSYERDREASNSTEEEAETADSPQRYTVMLEVQDYAEYDALYDALLQHRQTLIGTNRAGVERASDQIEELRNCFVGDVLTFELTDEELNRFHNAVRQQRLDYQGRNLREQLGALRRVENRVNTIREEHLF